MTVIKLLGACSVRSTAVLKAVSSYKDKTSLTTEVIVM